MKKLLIVVNVDWFFLSHCLPIAIEVKATLAEEKFAAQIMNVYES